MRFILDNILLIHKTLEWADHPNQPLIFLELDFSNAYDMFNLPFLFGALEKYGFLAKFIEMAKMLFKEASAMVKINGSQIRTFDIGCGVRQGCPLAPYMFLVVAEVINAMRKVEIGLGKVKGVLLPGGTKQQVIAQYADDTSLILLGKEESVRQAIYILVTFYMGSGLILNWVKSCEY
jgi:hypothetical protein